MRGPSQVIANRGTEDFFLARLDILWKDCYYRRVFYFYGIETIPETIKEKSTF